MVVKLNKVNRITPTTNITSLFLLSPFSYIDVSY